MHDLLVVGAGPYGLSIAAHAAAAGHDVRILGRPMASWRDHMPAGMFLKSEPWSSSLSDPAGRHTLAAWCAANDVPTGHGQPLPVATFTAYGMWFAQHAVPGVEERTVTLVRPREHGGFLAETADGDVLEARAVVMAAGVMPFVHMPATLRGLPGGLASHSSDHGDLSRFRGKDVTVVGAGQAALETAALLAEQGAAPRVVARAPALRWNTPPQPLERGLLRALRDPHSGLGTGWTTWVWSEAPWAVRRLPAALRTHIAARALGPAGAWWLRHRFESAVPVLTGTRLLAATAGADGRQVRLRLAGPDRTETWLETDHVVAATGFTPDLRRLPMLHPGLRDGLRRVPGTGAPLLDGGFGSSHPGLYFAGLPAVPSFGPSMRFVYGAAFTASRVASSLRAPARPRVPARRMQTPPGAERPGIPDASRP